MGKGSTFATFQDLAKALKTKTVPDKPKPKAKASAAQSWRANGAADGSRAPLETTKANGKQAKKARKGKKKKGEKLRVKISKAAWEAIKNAASPSDQSGKPAPTKTTIEQGQAQAAFQRITKRVASSSTDFETPPATIPATIADTLQKRIGLGATWFASHSVPDEVEGETNVIIGFDFGTSSAKIAVRDPFGIEDDIAAMEAPTELRSMEHPFLWQTAVWFDPSSKRFSLYPQPDFVSLSGFKTGIIGGYGNKRANKDIEVSRNEAAIAYLALHAAHLFGWLQSASPFGGAAPASYLRFNIGVPVAAIDNSFVCSQYGKIVAAAYELIPYADELDLAMVRSTFADAHEKTPEGFDLVPELAAAIAGYSSQKTAREGAHLLIDVGASTLDMVTFLRVTSKKATGIESSVELLGAAALEVARRAGEPDLECELACRHQYKELIDASRKESRTRVEFKAGREVQVIATGGGCNTELHKRFIGSRATKELLGEVPIIFPSPPAAITDEECDTQRLLLAYGLTMDVFEKVDLLPPSQTPNMSLQSKTEISAPGPEQC
ncbi:hypothetical protein K3163_02330 [Qipengyuania sp. 1NDW9]|uniref:hypothetical protein n=1 Tax=Qipengyuania xiapuensis TaxID=2867236 RepID=UPI001C86E05A|nr:hypothetical protein [Qipengyuania xiapuensis]MBX7492042.1 hypothetical protein [Qipengyuania xiapuensis]